jgi:signal transduction histidine kinase
MATPTDDQQGERAKTDKSLHDERAKTDEHLQRRRRQVEQQTADAIRADRHSADQERTRQRADMDQRRTGDHTRAGAQAVQQEREREDTAISLERKKQDSALRRERFEKRLIAEALLAAERGVTDASLRSERDFVDLASAENVRLLSEERFAHTQTKNTLSQREQALAMVSHDLKNPSIAITIGIHVMRKRLQEDSLDRSVLLKELAIIEQSAFGIDRMVDALLDIQKITHGKLPVHATKGDICVLLQEGVDLFAPIAANKSCFLIGDICPGPLWALFDHDRLLQVLSNLIGNAIKFTPPGGTITLSGQRHDGQVCISVSDNGPGIAEQDQAKLFKEFSQLQEHETGLGLGLFIAKSIVEAHGGHIRVASTMGQGSTFTFSLAALAEPLVPEGSTKGA